MTFLFVLFVLLRLGVVVVLSLLVLWRWCVLLLLLVGFGFLFLPLLARLVWFPLVFPLVVSAGLARVLGLLLLLLVVWVCLACCFCPLVLLFLWRGRCLAGVLLVVVFGSSLVDSFLWGFAPFLLCKRSLNVISSF